MKTQIIFLLIVLVSANSSFAAECSGYIQKAVQPPVPNIGVQLTKNYDSNNQSIEHFKSGKDQNLIMNGLRVFIDINKLDSSVKVLLGQKSGSVSSFYGAFSKDGTFKSSLSFNSNSELVIICKE